VKFSGAHGVTRPLPAALEDLCLDVEFGMFSEEFMKARLIGLIVAFGLLAGANGFGATARDLLASPAQSIRDVGAQILRGSFVPPPRANWEAFVKRLKPGMKKSAVEGELHSVNAVTDWAAGSGSWETHGYRLDDLWVVNCNYTNAVLAAANIQEKMKDVWINAPANFSGDWVTYWANGQTNSVRHYKNGIMEGFGTDFHTDGSKGVIYSFRNGIPDGEETGYFIKSGKIKYKGQYRDGKQVGHWIWYRQDGSVDSEKDFGK
jgi:hypothetical protein